jgi:hypothetical protein
MMRIIFVYAFLIISCSDATFQEIPKMEILAQSLEPQLIFRDSIPITRGLFYRQLSENNYRNIFGHAHLQHPQQQMKRPEYELIILSCQKDEENLNLICSINPRYHSIIDVVSYQPRNHKMLTLQQSRMASSFTDIKLLDITRLTARRDTLLIQASSEGMLTEIPLCCDF